MLAFQACLHDTIEPGLWHATNTVRINCELPSITLHNVPKSSRKGLRYLATDLQTEYEGAGIRVEVVLAIQQVIQRAHAGGAFQQGGLHPVGKAERRQVWASLCFRWVAVQYLHHCPGQAVCMCLSYCLPAGHPCICVSAVLTAGLATMCTRCVTLTNMLNAQQHLLDPGALKLRLVGDTAFLGQDSRWARQRVANNDMQRSDGKGLACGSSGVPFSPL